MARRVLFILLSFVVFGSALSSGYSYFMTRQAANDYRQTLIEKARVGAIVEEANRKEKRAKDGRVIAEKALKKLTQDYQKTKKSAVAFEKKIALLETGVEELKTEKNKAEEALRAALEESKTAEKVKDSSAGTVKALEKKLVSEKANGKKLKAAIKKAKKEAAKERKEKKAALAARAEAEKSLYSNTKELKSVNDKLKVTVAQLTEIQSKNKKVEQELALLKKEKASDKSDKKEAAKKGDSKEIAKLQGELKEAVKKLAEADKQVLALKNAQAAESKKIEDLKKGFEASKAELLKKIADAEKEAAEQKAVAAKAAKKAEEAQKTAAKSQNNKKEIKVAAAAGNNSSKESSAKKNEQPKSDAAGATKKEEDKEDEDKEKERQERAKLVQQELKRLGCYDGKVDGVWGRGSLDALVNFSNSANLDRVRKYPTKKTVTILKSKAGKVCNVAGAPEAKKQSVQQQKAGATIAEPKLQTLKEQCLASCIGAFESVQSCRDNC